LAGGDHAAVEAVLAERHDLSGLDVAQVSGADDVEGAGLAGDAVARPRIAVVLGRVEHARSRAAAGRGGSRKATTRSFVIATIENAPLSRGRTSAIASSTDSAGLVAIIAAMISESEVELKETAALEQLLV